MDKRITLLRTINKKAEEQQYPGYPFQLTGIIDLKNKKGMFDSYGRPMDILKFFEKFDSHLVFQALGSKLAQKGNWYNDGHKLAEYKKFISQDVDYDDFYFDNLNAVKLWFGVYSAYRQFKDKDRVIWFIIDDDSEYVDIKVFKNEQEIQKFIDECWTEEE